MKKRTAVYCVAGLVGITLALSPQKAPSSTQVTPAPVASLTSYVQTAPTPPRLPQQQRGRFGLLTRIERDLDTTWTTEDRADATYLIDLQLRFKQQFRMMPDAIGRNNPLGQILYLQRRGATRPYMIVGSNGNYFGSVEERLEGTLVFDLYDGDIAPLRRKIRTFEFVPREQQKRAY